MEASPRVGEADMESFWPGSGGSVCDSDDIALSPLVLSDSSSSTGAGCPGTDLAEASSVLGLQQLIDYYRLLSIMKIIDNDSHYRLVGSAHSARPTSAGRVKLQH